MAPKLRAQQLSLLTQSGQPRRRREPKRRRGVRLGRPPKPDAGVTHLRRPRLGRSYPAHVTWRVVSGLSNLRGSAEMRVLRSRFSKGRDRFGFRLVHFSVQKDHIHVIAEAESATSLARGLQGLAVRVARGLNKHWKRKGKVFADRYHARILRTPKEARAALVYVMTNASYCSTWLHARNREFELRRRWYGGGVRARTRLLRDAAEHIGVHQLLRVDDPRPARDGP